MPDVVVVIAQEIFRDEEYAEPKAVLEGRGARVVTASVAPGQCIGKLGMTAAAMISVEQAASTRWDAAVFVGGSGASVFFDDVSAHRLASDTLEGGGVLGAICIAPSVLARAGLLDGVRSTAFPTQEGDLREHGAIWTGEQVSVDGRVATACGPEAATEFGEAVAGLLGI